MSANFLWCPQRTRIYRYTYIYIYIYVFIYITFGRYLRMPAWFFFFKAWKWLWLNIDGEQSARWEKKKWESTWNTLFLKRKLKTVAAERGTIIYLWYSTFFFVFLILKDTDFFFSHLGFISLLLFTDETSFCLFPLFRPSLANATLKQRICFFFFRGSFSFFLLFCCCTFFFYCCCCVQVTI